VTTIRHEKNSKMTRKQLAALFICILVPWTVGNGVLPLLPVYATQLGASPAISGYYLSFSYLSLALGTFTAGWISDRFQRRRQSLIIVGFALIPFLLLMGQSTNILILTLITGFVWFLGGIAITMINILAGIFADWKERGRVFGVLSLAGGLGALVGGFSTGLIADNWGFSGLFIALAVFSLLMPITSFFLKDREVIASEKDGTGSRGGTKNLGLGFYIFLLASILIGVALFSGRLGTSLVMKNLAFSSTAISSTGAIAGLGTMPLSLYLGILSDRLGRKSLLGICYFCGTLGIGLLAIAAPLFQFWLAVSLISIMGYVSPGVGAAFVTDLIPTESLGRGMSFFNSTTWVGGVVGFAAAGLAIEQFGWVTTFIYSAVLPVIGILLLMMIKIQRQVK
jgi:MFS family permease